MKITASHTNPDNSRNADAIIFQYRSAANKMIETVIFLLVTVFPLILHDSYYDILETKYCFYTLCILILSGAMLLLAFYMAGIHRKSLPGVPAKALLSRLHPGSWEKNFCAADAMVLGFWLTAVISTLQSRFPYEAFWGNEGRYSGLFLLTLYVVSYFLISRFWFLYGRLFDVFLASGMILCLFGITDYFQMDILHFRKDSPASMASFTSTLGNINTYTAYVGMLLGLSAALFALEKNLKKSIWYYACFIVSLTAIILGRSDNAYLSLAAVFIFLPFVLFSDKKGRWKYLFLVTTFFTALKMIRIADVRFADRTFGLFGLFQVISNLKALSVLAPVLWVLTVTLGFYCWKHPKKETLKKHRTITYTYIWAALILTAFLLICLLLFDANKSGQEEKYAALGSYLIFNDRWGSGRGYIWKKSLWIYSHLTPMGKLFGCGPDTFGCLVSQTILLQMQNDTGMFFDNAHNSFLQYLVTIGLLGLAFYLLFLGASFVRLFRNRTRSPYIAGALLAVICYVSQSLVNLDLPIVTPVMWLLISMGMAGSTPTGHPHPVSSPVCPSPGKAIPESSNRHNKRR